MTDAVSFNTLCREQLEYFSQNFDLTLVSGGREEELTYLKNRNVGNVVYIPMERKPHLFKDMISLGRLWKFLAKNDFDLIVYSTPKALLIASLAKCLNVKRSKSVAIVQGRVYENFPELKKKAFMALDKVSFTLSDKVVFVSNSLQENYFRENIVNSRASKVIGSGSFNGVNESVFHSVNLENKESLRVKYGFSKSEFLICIIGRICIDKGIEDVYKIARKINNNNIKFVFVGSFEDERSKYKVKCIVKEERGYYIPYLKEIHEIFQCSDLHLFLSHREGFGNVAIEAASCGVPTFAYDVTGVKDSVKNGISGQRFDFKDTKAIARAIDEAAKSTDFSSKYPNARSWAVENFEQKKVWQNYLEFYLNQIQDER